MQPSTKSALSLYVAIVAISAALFGIDTLTRVGYAEWLLYLVPVALTLFQPRPLAPFLVVGGQIVLLITGFLMSPDGTPKISDFGLAKILFEDIGVSLNGVLLGTPSYMAPEQVSGSARGIGPATDTYALGAIHTLVPERER